MQMILKSNLSGLRNKAAEWPKAGMRALNKLAPSLKTMASTLIRGTYSIKKQDLDSHFYVKAASVTTLRVRLGSTGRPLIASKFGVGRKTAKGVVVNIKRGKPTMYAHAFKAPLSTGTVLIFHRLSKTRYPIWPVYGPSIEQLFGSTRMQSEVTMMTDNKLPALLDHEIAFLRGQLS